VVASVRVATGSLESLHLLPVAASVLTATQINQSAALTGDEVLRALPGFDRTRSNSAFTNYGQLRVSFSGAGNDRGLVLADGIPAQDGFGGQVDWAEYPAADLIRAEMLRGPGSALYGAGAIGGVLSLQNYGPTSDTTAPPRGLLSIGSGSHDYADIYARTDTALSNTLSASFSYAQSQLSYDDLAPGYQASDDVAAQSRSEMGSIRLRYAPSASDVVDYGYRGAWDYQQEGRPNYNFWRRLTQNSLGFAHSANRGALRIDVYERNAFVTNMADRFPRAPGTLLYTQNVPTHESGASADWIVDSAHSTFEIRADVRSVGGASDQYGPTGNIESSGSGTQTLSGLAFQETWRVSRAEFVAGIRDDAIDLAHATMTSGTTMAPIAPRIDRALSPRLAARYDVTHHLALRVSGGDGFRAPFLNELVRGYQIGATKYLPNPNLVPERSSSFSGGLDWTFGGSELSIDLVRTSVNDAIDFLTVSPTEQIRNNFSHTQTNAVTAEFVRAIATCTRLDVFGAENNARITDGSAADIGKQLPYVPKTSATASLEQKFGATEAGVSVSYLGMTYADDLNVEPLGTATTLGAHAEIPLGRGAQLVLSADNLTDARYLSSIDRYAPPQVISLSVRLPLYPITAATDACPHG